MGCQRHVQGPEVAGDRLSPPGQVMQAFAEPFPELFRHGRRTRAVEQANRNYVGPPRSERGDDFPQYRLHRAGVKGGAEHVIATAGHQSQIGPELKRLSQLPVPNSSRGRVARAQVEVGKAGRLPGELGGDPVAPRFVRIAGRRVADTLSDAVTYHDEAPPRMTRQQARSLSFAKAIDIGRFG